MRSQKRRVSFHVKPSPPLIHYYKTQNITLSADHKWSEAICPFHPDAQSSLHINIERGAYRCKVCGARGSDLLAFHMHKHGLNFVEACKQLGAWVTTC